MENVDLVEVGLKVLQLLADAHVSVEGSVEWHHDKGDVGQDGKERVKPKIASDGLVNSCADGKCHRAPDQKVVKPGELGLCTRQEHVDVAVKGVLENLEIDWSSLKFPCAGDLA